LSEGKRRRRAEANLKTKPPRACGRARPAVHQPVGALSVKVER